MRLSVKRLVGWTIGMACCIAGSLQGSGTPWKITSSLQQVPLLELYTSEGCSSCPPAEARLAKLEVDPDLFKQFVPVAFHVDYWDSIGWKDPWGAAEFSKRQRVYAQVWGNHRVYTPCFILNGQEAGSRLDSHVQWTDASTARPGVLEARQTAPRTFAISFTSTESLPTSEVWRVHAAWLGCGLSSAVTAGENRGRTLAHSFVVLSYTQTPCGSSTSTLRATLTLAPLKGVFPKRAALAAWMTRGEDPTPIQAVGGFLPAP